MSEISVGKRAFLGGLLMALLLGVSIAQAAVERCSLCRMRVKDDSKTHFVVSHDGKTHHMCSFICAKHYRKRFPKSEIFIHDYSTNKRVPADKAYFIVKSKNLESQLHFGMPPAVVGFSKKSLAEELKTQLKDGKVVRGFHEIEKQFN